MRLLYERNSFLTSSATSGAFWSVIYLYPAPASFSFRSFFLAFLIAFAKSTRFELSLRTYFPGWASLGWLLAEELLRRFERKTLAGSLGC